MAIAADDAVVASTKSNMQAKLSTAEPARAVASKSGFEGAVQRGSIAPRPPPIAIWDMAAGSFADSENGNAAYDHVKQMDKIQKGVLDPCVHAERVLSNTR